MDMKFADSFLKERAAELIVNEYLDKKTQIIISDLGSVTPIYSGVKNPENRGFIDNYDEVVDQLNYIELILQQIMKAQMETQNAPFGLDPRLIPWYSTKSDFEMLTSLKKLLRDMGNKTIEEIISEDELDNNELIDLIIDLSDDSCVTLGDCYAKLHNVLLAKAVNADKNKRGTDYPLYILRWCDEILN